jgi:hypothetical protein
LCTCDVEFSLELALALDLKDGSVFFLDEAENFFFLVSTDHILKLVGAFSDQEAGLA